MMHFLNQQSVKSLLFVTISVAAVSACSSQSEGIKVEGFPEDIPVYKGLEDISLSDIGPLRALNGATSDDLKAVVAFYNESLPKQGWTNIKEATAPDPKSELDVLSFEKDERKLTIMIHTDYSGKTKISIQVQGLSNSGTVSKQDVLDGI